MNVVRRLVRVLRPRPARDLLSRVAEEHSKRTWNPRAVYSGPQDDVFVSERGTVGLVAIRRPQSEEEMEHVCRFVKQGGKLVCLPMIAGFPTHDYVPALIASGYICDDVPENIHGMPHLQIGITDFHSSLARCHPGKEKKFDFIICTWANNIREKRWDLALELVESLCGEHTMALVVYKGSITPNDMERLQPFIEREALALYPSWVPKEQFSELLRAARVGIVNAEWDAHPRYLDQLLLSDVPVVLNERIYGGRRVVCGGNGEIVPPERIAETAKRMLTNLLSYAGTRERFLKQFGPYNAARRFTSFINRILGTNYGVIVPEGWAYAYEPDYIRTYAVGLADPHEFFPSGVPRKVAESDGAAPVKD